MGPKLNSRLAQIKLIVLDVDGVLSDGAIIYTEHGDHIKPFDVKDGFGITLALHAGIKFAVITGRTSEIVRRRVKELKIQFYKEGHFQKPTALHDIIQQAEVTKEEVLYIGDDILDLACAPYVGVFAAPSDCVERVKREADIICNKSGGHGCVREMIDRVLDNQGLLKKTENYFLSGGT